MYGGSGVKQKLPIVSFYVFIFFNHVVSYKHHRVLTFHSQFLSLALRLSFLGLLLLWCWNKVAYLKLRVSCLSRRQKIARSSQRAWGKQKTGAWLVWGEGIGQGEEPLTETPKPLGFHLQSSRMWTSSQGNHQLPALKKHFCWIFSVLCHLCPGRLWLFFPVISFCLGHLYKYKVYTCFSLCTWEGVSNFPWGLDGKLLKESACSLSFGCWKMPWPQGSEDWAAVM